MNSKLVLKDESYAIRGAVFEVYKEKGCGFAECVYQECLEIELELRGIPYVRQPALGLSYKGRELKSSFTPDLVCFGLVVIELKAVVELTDGHRAQLQNYLRSIGFELGLLVNLGHFPGVELERYVMKDGRFARESTRLADSEKFGI